MNRLYRDLVIERIAAAIDAARAVAGVEHAGVKGAIREVLIGDLFRPQLPSDVGVATGIVISADDVQSPQQDILISDRRVLPAITFHGGLSLIPIESALMAIEVKSRLTMTELRSAHEGARELMRLRMLSGQRDETGRYVDRRASSIQPLLFALDTDLRGDIQAEAARYDTVCGEDPPYLRAICVVGRGTCVPTDRFILNAGDLTIAEGEPLARTWHHTTSDGRYGEVVELLSALHGLLERMGTSRGRPPISAYLQDDRVHQ